MAKIIANASYEIDSDDVLESLGSETLEKEERRRSQIFCLNF